MVLKKHVQKNVFILTFLAQSSVVFDFFFFHLNTSSILKLVNILHETLKNIQILLQNIEEMSRYSNLALRRGKSFIFLLIPYCF